MAGIAIACAPAGASAQKSVESPRLVVQLGHDSVLTGIAFSPDGRTLVSGSWDKTLRLWDVATGRELRTFLGQAGQIDCVAYSPDGRIVVSGSKRYGSKQADMLKFWDVRTGKELRNLVGHAGSVTGVAFSPDGNMLASSSEDHTVKLWDVATGQAIRTLTGHDWWVRSVAFAPDGRTLASGGHDGSVRLWDAATGQSIRKLAGHTGSVRGLAFSPDGTSLASVSEDQTVKVWDVAGSREPRTIQTEARYLDTTMGVVFSPDGKLLASAGKDNSVALWDAKTGVPVRAMKGHTTVVTDIVFSADGTTVASASNDRTVRIWETATGRELRSLSGQGGRASSLAVSPDGKTLALGSGSYIRKTGNPVKLWNLSLGHEAGMLAGHQDAILAIAFSPDGRAIASASEEGKVKLWDAVGGHELRTLDGHKLEVTAIAFSPDGRKLASGSGDKTVVLWDVATGRRLDSRSYRAVVNSVVFSPDGRSILAGLEENTLEDSTLMIWSIAGDTEPRPLGSFADSVYDVAYAPDGRTVAVAEYKRIALRDAATGRTLHTLAGHANHVAKVAFSPDGRTLLSGGRDMTVRFWDVVTGRLLRSNPGHTGAVTGVAFSPDGQVAFSSSSDATIRLWRTGDGAPLATLASFKDGRWAVTDAAGRFDVADLEDMPHIHWVMADDPLAPLPIEVFMRDYYEPRLLSRILSGEQFPPVRNLGTLNRVQPVVRITGIAPIPDAMDHVDVSVEATGSSRSVGPDGHTMSTAAHDLRLFRDGQLVAYTDGRIAAADGESFRHTWRIRLPAGKNRLTFSAYAFNDAGIKSATTSAQYTPQGPSKADAPVAWLIHVGVNRHENASWNLEYAANDARRINASLTDRLAAQNRYREIVSIMLVADKASRLATKNNIRAVLNRLAGKPANLAAVPGGDMLRRTGPNDLVLISFSGHGVNTGGKFYLIPSDIGPGTTRLLTPEMLPRIISSDELADWLRDVDGGDIAMIIDACQSGASVGNDFKPGPMGARGLGQLAYEKGMRILAASQAEEYAQESSLTEQGLLSYALVRDGLERGKADFQPRDARVTLSEWLRYGVRRVPYLAEEVARGEIESRGLHKPRKIVRRSATEEHQDQALQQPALFDFTKGRRDSTLQERPEASAPDQPARRTN